MSRPKENYEDRKKAKQAERRRLHRDKYADKASGTKADRDRPEADHERR